MATAQSSEAPSRPAKRARPESMESEHTFSGSPDFWFEDGNVILISAGEGPSKIGFKVHLGFLARHSEFFDDMFKLAHPSASDGCACTNLPVTDSAEDLNYFLHAVYDIGYFIPEKEPTPFPQLAAMLRMATKYICPKLRADVISHLEEIYPTQSRHHLDISQSLIPKEFLVNRVHAIYAIQMARENDVPSIMPTAFYLATTIHPMEYVLYNHVLTPDDDRRVIAGRARITEKVLEDVWSWLMDQPLEHCASYECRRTRWIATQDLARNASTAANLFIEPMLHECMNVVDKNSQGVGEKQICRDCFGTWMSFEEEQYDDLWQELPVYFGLPGWKR